MNVVEKVREETTEHPMVEYLLVMRDILVHRKSSDEADDANPALVSTANRSLIHFIDDVCEDLRHPTLWKSRGVDQIEKMAGAAAYLFGVYTRLCADDVFAVEEKVEKLRLSIEEFSMFPSLDKMLLRGADEDQGRQMCTFESLGRTSDSLLHRYQPKNFEKSYTVERLKAWGVPGF